MNTMPRAASVLALSILLVLVPASGQTPDRTVPPQPGPPPNFAMKPIQHFTLKCGLPLLLIEKHDVPLVQINLLVRTGSAMDPGGKSGLASMVAAMLLEGSGNRDALQLADAIDYLGATITSTSGQHAMAVRLRTPLVRLDSALALFADVILRPTFPAEELERKRTERLTALLQWRDEPRMLASVAFNRALYGTHPYGLPVLGNEQTLKGISRADVQQFHETWFHPNLATLVVAGDVKPKELLARLESAFGRWRQAAATAPELPRIEQVKERSVLLVDKPGAAQTVIRIGRIGVARSTDDYYSIVVMNTILGGSFTSRLNDNLREQKGYTYGAGSFFDFRPLPGPFIATASVQTAVTDKALIEFLKELEGIRKPAESLELARAKNYVALSFPSDFQTTSDLAGHLEEMVTDDLPDDYFNTYIPHILGVTKNDVREAAEKYIDPSRLIIVLVGDRQVIEAPVRALNLGPVTVQTVTDVLGAPPVIENGK